jgi:uncharacterized protein DUF6600
LRWQADCARVVWAVTTAKNALTADVYPDGGDPMTRRLMATFLALATLLGTVPGAGAATPPGAAVPPGAADPETGAVGRTPPRLGYLTGDVSLWRPGASDWAPAALNMPLAPGDELYTGNNGNAELQVGSRAFVRAWGDTQLGLANQEPDFLQFKVTTGHVSLDLRSLDAGRTVELATPHGAFTIDRPGYYRADVTETRTSFISRRGGRATMTPAGGDAVAIQPSEEVVVEAAGGVAVQSFVAPDLDVWDRWNYTRTDDLLDTMSARYVPSDVYGVDDLDQHGTWRVVQTYGAVWVPSAVPAGWAPYSTGRWVWDPFYGWTWVDAAPWGWAPYHYGRWVSINGVWAWAPGPIVRRAVYAPALVVFFGAPGVRVTVGAPFVSWVALGWGEPVVPWWGRPGFVGRPWWGGWGGPRVVNNVVVNRTTVVNVNTINVYQNVNVHNAVLAVPREQFGRRAVHEDRVANVDTRRLEPVRGALQVAPTTASLVGDAGRAAVVPPTPVIERRVVATRQPARRAIVPRAEAERSGPAPRAPEAQIVRPPRAASTPATPARPPFGRSDVERAPRSETPRLEATPAPATSRQPERVTPSARQPEHVAPAPAVRQPEPPSARQPERGTPPVARQPERVVPPAARQPEQVTPPAARQPEHVAPPAARQERPTPPPPEARGRADVAPQRGPQIEAPRPAPRDLPGEPANRVFPGRGQGRGGDEARGRGPRDRD